MGSLTLELFACRRTDDALGIDDIVSCRGTDRDEILVQLRGLVQPLPGLVQRVDAVSNTNTVATAVKGHSF